MSTSTTAAACSGGSVRSAASTASEVSRSATRSRPEWLAGRVEPQRLGRPHRSPPGEVEAGVDDDAVQPGRHRRAAAEPGGAPVRREQRVLQRVGGVLRVAESPQRDRPQPVAVPGDQLAEGVGVARDVAGQQLVVARVARCSSH